MKSYDIGISQVYAKDERFVKFLREKAKSKNQNIIQVDYNNVSSVIDSVNKNEINFRLFLDLGSFENPVFAFLSEKLSNKETKIINSPESMKNSFSKSHLHEVLKSNDIPLRKTFVLNKKAKNNLGKVIKDLGKPFVLSPGVSSYEKGIILNAKDKGDIKTILDDYPKEDVLAHEYLVPKIINEKVAWFRIIYSCGEILYHWWDPNNHFYIQFGNSDEENKITNETKNYVEKIAELTGLCLFSTEIISDTNGNYVIIDYANNPIDLSSQKDERDGVPEETLNKIADSILKEIK